MITPARRAALWTVALLLPATAFGQVESTFDTDLEGWIVVGDNEATWNGGVLDVNDLVTGSANLASAPPKFLGDWSALTSADSLSWAIFFSNTSGGTLVAPSYMARIAGPGGDARGIVPGVVPTENTWTTFALPLDPRQAGVHVNRESKRLR